MKLSLDEISRNCSRIFRINAHRDEKLNKQESTEKQEYVSSLVKQILVALAPLLLTVCSGMTVGYSAILLPQLHADKNGTLIINEEDASWIASMAALPMAAGSVLGGVFIEQFGRKATHSLSCLPFLIGWLLIAFAFDKNMILAGRFVTGACLGMLGPATGVYIGETSQPSYRGFLLAGISFSVALGLFLSHLFGTFFSWRTTALICASLPVLSQIIILFVPESPSWLAKKGQPKRAQQSFYWCRGYSEEAKRELAVMLERQEQTPAGDKKTLPEKLRELLVPEFLKPLGIIVFYIVSNQWAGINALTFYTVSIMKETIGEGVNEYLAMLIVDTIRVLMSLVACVLLRKIGRRPLALVSGVGTSVSLLSIGAYSFLAKSYPQLKSASYVPMISLVAYMVFITVGFVPLPWAMIGEIFPLKNRSVGSGISSFMAFTAFFSVVKTSPGMFQNLGTGATFFTYGLVAVVATIFVYFLLPETKGRILHEIEDSFRKKKTNEQAT
ncbi:facilitated trehalose transporter Tret1 isoform X1 [Leptinotarsa decemlineata]|uniref:facilitated trehalose transporter Tret1 isoform X1 n=1 Tax=Leptinotarsa decemlineata TaxID=7539 RepID=UPI003D3062E5